MAAKQSMLINENTHVYWMPAISVFTQRVWGKGKCITKWSLYSEQQCYLGGFPYFPVFTQGLQKGTEMLAILVHIIFH